MNAQGATLVVAILAFVAALASLRAQYHTLQRQEERERRATTALLVREIAAGPASQSRDRRESWFQMKGAGVRTRPAVDAFALDSYNDELRLAAAQWAVDQMEFSGYEVFGNYHDAETAQRAANAFDRTYWQVSFYSGIALIPAESEEEARMEFLFRLGELRENNPSDERIRTVLADKVELSDEHWPTIPISVGDEAWQQPRTVASLQSRDDEELLGRGQGALIAGRSVPASQPRAAARDAEHDRIRQEFRRFPLRFLGPFVPTRSSII